MFGDRRFLPAIFVFSICLTSLYLIPSWQSPDLSSLALQLTTLYSPKGCPSPLEPILPTDKPLETNQQICSPLRANDNTTAFDVELCTIPTSCNSWSVRIRRTNQDACKLAEEMTPPTHDETLQEWMKESGPDSFHLRTSGSQRWASESPVYEGDCTYRFDVSLSNGGTVWLELWWMYENYEYMNELSNDYPSLKFQSLLSAPTRINACPSTCPMEYAPRMRDTESSWPLNTLTPPPLPECPLEGPLPGIWLPRNHMDTLDPPYIVQPPMTGIKPLQGIYEFYPNCIWKHSGMTFNDHQKCMDNGGKEKKVLFMGDSHSRYAMLNFMHRLEGRLEPYPENDKGVGMYGKMDPAYDRSYGDLHMHYDQDPHGVNLPNWEPEHLAKYDVIIYSLGAWAAMLGQTSQTYLDKITKVVNHIDHSYQKIQPSHKQIKILMLPAPFPPHTSGSAVERKDQRTNPQLAKFRDIAISKVLEHGWRVVDQYDRGLPVGLDMLAADGLHLSPGMAESSLIDEIVGKAEIC